jgi:hypothetical protein
MSFSQRIGKKLAIKSIQLESIDDDLRNGLWNILKLTFLDEHRKTTHDYNSTYYEFAQLLWHKFYKLPIDLISSNDHHTESIIREKFFSVEWNEVYDFLEFIASLENIYDTDQFIEQTNEVLETEFSAYRFIDGLISPISNIIEIDEIKEALNQNNQYTSLNGANIHLANALGKLSDRKNPDYRNSIKESISALETTCRILTGESTLGKALKSLDSKGIKIDDQLKSGYEKIYAFTNNKESGIRHAIVDEHNSPDFDDAKYILLLCSSLINYLIGKCKTLKFSI